MPRPPKTTGTRIIEYFRSRYFEEFNKEYNINYGMISMAEKIAPYYSMYQIRKSIDFIFKYQVTHSIYDYLRGVDRFLDAAEMMIDREKMYEEAEKETTLLVKKIASKKIGRKS